MTEALIARLKALTAPCRKTDVDIAQHFGWTPIHTSADEFGVVYAAWQSPDGRICPGPPRYTEILDVALMARPSGMYWLAGAGKARPDEMLYGAALFLPEIGVTVPIAEGESDANAAIAMMIAILEARRRAPAS